jgi:membrane protein YdbS with pleckstrin-like domain
MSARFVQTQIKSLPMFELLTPEQLPLVASAFQIIRFDPGEYLFQQGQPTQGLFVFVSGRATLVRLAADRYSEERLGDVIGGQYINEAALFEAGVESASLRAVEQCVVLFLSRVALQTMLAARPEMAHNIRGTLSQPERQAVQLLFKGQRENEAIIRVFRRHPWSFFRFSWIAVLMAVALLAAAAFFGAASSALVVVLVALAFVLPGGLMFYLYSEWKDDALFLTSERVVKIHNNLLTFTNQLNEMPLERVLEVNIEIPPRDPLARAFNYGTVKVRTAGETGNINMSWMSEPLEVQQAVFAERDRFRQVIAQRNRGAVRADVERVLGLRNNTSGNAPTRGQQDVKQQTTSGFAIARTRFINENGEMVYRKHLTVWFDHIFLPTVLFLAGVVVLVVSLTVPTAPEILTLPFALILMLVGAVWFYLRDWDWRNDIFVIGNQSITITRKRPLWLENQVDRISMAQIDNVVSDVSGLLNNILNRGFVKIFLIGSERPKILEPIADPQEVHGEISRRQSAVKNQAAQAEAQRERQAISDYLAAYHEALSHQNPQPLAPPDLYGARAPQPGENNVPYFNSPPPNYNGQTLPPNLRPTQVNQPPTQPNYPSPPYQQPNQQNYPPPNEPPAPPEPPPPPPRDGIRPPNIPRRRPDGG